jgi:LacI family transcriptional regulator
VTIADVAAAAGVSLGTVSKAMNGRGRMRPETRQRVQAVAAQMGYQPNVSARALQGGSSYTVGILSTDRIGRFSIPIMSGAEHTLGAGEMSVFLCDARDDQIREQYYLRTLLSRRVDGIIVTGRRTDERPSISAAVPVPVVYAFIRSDDPADTSVVPDERLGVELALSHLLATGRRSIGHITGPRHHHSALLRATESAAFLAERGGLALVTEPFFGEWSEAWGRNAAERLLAAAPETDAIFCGSDQVARGVVQGLQRIGKSVPGDVAVVGFDNWDVMALGCQPPLTTLDMDLEGLGRRAAEQLLRAIGGTPAPGVQLHPPQLVIRESTVS